MPSAWQETKIQIIQGLPSNCNIRLRLQYSQLQDDSAQKLVRGGCIINYLYIVFEI